MTKYKFIAVMDDGIFDRTDRTVTFETDVGCLSDESGDGLLRDFRYFLLACGFAIGGDLIVEEQIDCDYCVENTEDRDDAI